MKSNMKKTETRKILLAALITAVLLATLPALAGCSGAPEGGGAGSGETVSRDFFAMDTYMTVSAWGDGADDTLKSVEDMIVSMENQVSTERPSSEIAKLNKDGSGTLSGDSLNIVSGALDLYKETGGAFNISIYPIMKAWGFTTKEYRVPSDEELAALLENTDLSTVSFDRETGKISFGQEGMEIDLGGITKGYASAKAVEIFKEAGLPGGLVNLGGNVQTFGKKPDGSLWKVAVQSPYPDDDYLGVIELTDKAVITSGGYERNFEKDGKTYHHIMDPETGKPAEKGLLSVTIISDDGMAADGLSTSLFVMGKDKAEEFWRGHREDFDFIMMDENNELFVSEGIADSFQSEKYKVTVVR